MHNYLYMSKPSSFATMSTKSCSHELMGFLYSLSLYHTNSNIYIMCDSETKKNYDSISIKPKLNIKWFIELNKYSNYNRQEMEDLNIWNEFQMTKANIIKKALKFEKDVLFLDSDIIITDIINDIDKTKKLGVCPGFIKQDIVDKVGYYNGGILWTSCQKLPDKWIKYSIKSRYFDQASIEDLKKDYENESFEFDENYNMQFWRLVDNVSIHNYDVMVKKFTVNNNQIFFNSKPLKFIHTHFKNSIEKANQPNLLFIKLLNEAKMYRELLIINYIINSKWIFKIPKQPMNGIWRHNNDSFREIPKLWSNKYNDIVIQEDQHTGHCWLGNNILLYDRPTMEWANNELFKSSLVLLGNGNIKKEGKHLIENCVNCKPWFFWARRPTILDKKLESGQLKSYIERKSNIVFIGNFENQVQEKYRKTSDNWESVVDKYYCTLGEKHLFSQEEYLEQLSLSKYGLCLRGYGRKCHREVELMAFGTVPLVTKYVSIESYLDPPIENIHYIKVKNPKDLEEKISKISEEKWKEMSKACHEWYMRNVHYTNSWESMMNNLFYN